MVVNSRYFIVIRSLMVVNCTLLVINLSLIVVPEPMPVSLSLVVEWREDRNRRQSAKRKSKEAAHRENFDGYRASL